MPNEWWILFEAPHRTHSHTWMYNINWNKRYFNINKNRDYDERQAAWAQWLFVSMRIVPGVSEEIKLDHMSAIEIRLEKAEITSAPWNYLLFFFVRWCCPQRKAIVAVYYFACCGCCYFIIWFLHKHNICAPFRFWLWKFYRCNQLASLPTQCI